MTEPDLKAAQAAFANFIRTIAAIRHPETGCPWDLQQDHASLRRYMIEEAYEASEAMASGDPRAICDELGDVLLQVVLNAQIALDNKQFSIADVAQAIDDKMRRRHPHVFGTEAERAKRTADWNAIKTAEKKAAGKDPDAGGVFSEAHTKHPASLQALAIGKIASKIKFDWDTPQEVFAQVRSEIDELEKEFARKERDDAKMAEEIGDVYFSLAQLCRHLALDPETVAVDANRKFLRRFAALEGLAAKRGIDVRKASRDELEDLWKGVKREER